MRRYATGLGLVTLALGGCATSKPPDVGYLAPTGLPPTARTASIQQEPGLVFGNLVDRLQQDGFTVSHIDEQEGEVVVEYKGDPEPYVDCGWIVTYRPGKLARTPAAAASASFDRQIGRNLRQLKRELQLDSRMVIRIDQVGPDTLISPAATYVLTKTIDVTASDGTSRGRAHETISFATGRTGTFSKGTVCQPNGRFERIVLDNLPATSVVASSPRVPATPAGSALAPAPPADQPGAPAGFVADQPVAPPPSAPAEPVAPPAAVADAPAEPVAPPAAVADAPRTPLVVVPDPSTVPQSIEPAAPPLRVVTESAEALKAQVAEATAAVSCGAVDARFGDGNSVRLTGYVGSEQDIIQLRRSLGQIAGLGTIETDLEVDPWPMCELLAVLAPYRESGPELTITTDSRTTELHEGEDLTLDIFLPRTARYLYLGFVQHDGRVGYIATMPVREWAEGTGAIRFATGFHILEPYGREMIVAVASAHPLFVEARRAYEPADDYIAALRQRLAALEASGPEPSVAVSHLFITTGPSRSF